VATKEATDMTLPEPLQPESAPTQDSLDILHEAVTPDSDLTVPGHEVVLREALLKTPPLAELELHDSPTRDLRFPPGLERHRPDSVEFHAKAGVFELKALSTVKKAFSKPVNVALAALIVGAPAVLLAAIAPHFAGLVICGWLALCVLLFVLSVLERDDSDG
jgi:hypothetical protein